MIKIKKKDDVVSISIGNSHLVISEPPAKALKADEKVDEKEEDSGGKIRLKFKRSSLLYLDWKFSSCFVNSVPPAEAPKADEKVDEKEEGSGGKIILKF